MQREICDRIAQTLASAPIHDHLGYEALAYLKLPGPDYLHLLRTLHLTLKPKLYVEIGVREGKSLALAEPETRCVAIDPALQIFERPGTLMARTTSDEFFSQQAMRDKARGFDLAFIDGDHSAEQALRDFENLESLAGPHSIIAFHDVIPMDEQTSTPQAQTSFHTGDVWKVMADIVLQREDLIAFTVACPPTGLGIVARFGERKGLRLRPWPLIPPWDLLVGTLNIVPNEPGAIMAAFNGGAK